MTRWATVYGPSGFRYTFSDEDYDWAIRMVGREAGVKGWTTPEGYAVLWTVLNRWVDRVVRGVTSAKTYWAFARTFSQPINPLWLPGGALTPRRPNPDAERFRLRLQTMPLADVVALYPGAPAVVAKFMRGEVAAGPYAGVSDFIMHGEGGGLDDIGPVALPGIADGANDFYKETHTRDWTAGTVYFKRPFFLAGAGIVFFSALAGWLFAARSVKGR